MPGLARRQAGATSALLVVLASERLDLAPSGYGWLLGAIGIGAVLGPYALTRLVNDPRRPAYVFGSYVLRGTVDLVLADLHCPVGGDAGTGRARAGNIYRRGHLYLAAAEPHRCRGSRTGLRRLRPNLAARPAVCRCCWAPCWQQRWASRPSTTSVADFYCWPGLSDGGASVPSDISLQ